MVRAFGQKTAAQQIESVAQNDPSLTTLDLTKNASFCMKTLENIQALSDALTKNTVITQLVLRECSIEDQGIEFLGKALESNHTIEELDLQHNHITTNGLIALSTGLSKNKGVRSLNLLEQAAKFGDDSIEAFINCFATNITLVKIMWQTESVRTWELARLITRNVEIQKKQKKGEDIMILLPKALGGQGGTAKAGGGGGGSAAPAPAPAAAAAPAPEPAKEEAPPPVTEEAPATEAPAASPETEEAQAAEPAADAQAPEAGEA